MVWKRITLPPSGEMQHPAGPVFRDSRLHLGSDKRGSDIQFPTSLISDCGRSTYISATAVRNTSNINTLSNEDVAAVCPTTCTVGGLCCHGLISRPAGRLQEKIAPFAVHLQLCKHSVSKLHHLFGTPHWVSRCMTERLYFGNMLLTTDLMFPGPTN